MVGDLKGLPESKGMVTNTVLICSLFLNDESLRTAKVLASMYCKWLASYKGAISQKAGTLFVFSIGGLKQNESFLTSVSGMVCHAL